MNQLKILSVIVGILAIVYVFTYSLPPEIKANIWDSLFTPLNSITGFLTEEDYLGTCSDPATNQTPYFPCTLPSQINLTQGDNFVYQICYADPENDTVLVKAAPAPGEDSWNKIITGMNFSGFINITLDNSDVGIHKVIYLLQDACHNDNLNNKQIIYYVNNTNDPPAIIDESPNETGITILENETAFFSINATDPDLFVDERVFNESLNYTWTLNSSVVKVDANTKNTSSSYTKFFDFCSAGLWPLTIKVEDKSGASDEFSWTIQVIDVNRPPYQNKSFPNNITLDEDTALYDALNLYDYFTDPDLVECGTNDTDLNFTSSIDWVLVNNTTKNISIIPPPDLFGEVNVSFTVSDGKSQNQSENLTIIVNPVPDAPRIENLTNKTAVVGFPFYYKVDAYDPDNDSITFYDNTTLFEIDPNTGEISFTPQASDVGLHHINITVVDNTSRETWAIFNLSIIINQPPVFTKCDNITTHENNNTLVEVEFYDPDNDNVTVSDNSTLFDLNQVNNTYASATFIPRNSDVGNHSVNITVTDVWNSSTSCIMNIEVIDINNPPVLSEIESPQQLRINKSYYLKASATDADNDPLNFSDNSSIINISNDGVINITNVSMAVGDYLVNISVCDPYSACDWQDVVFSVKINHPPVFTNLQNSFTCEEDKPCYIDINATDPENDSFTFSINDSNVFINKTSGEINFTPNISKNLTLTVYATDVWNDSNSTVIFINVTPRNDPPIILDKSTLNITAEVNTNVTIEIFLYDEENDTINLTINDTSLFNLTEVNNTYYNASFFADSSKLGLHLFNLTASDYNSNTSRILTINIVPENKPPTILNRTPSDSSQGMYEMDSMFFSVNATDSEGEELTYRYYLDGKLVSTTQNYTYRPGWYDSGTHDLVVNISDEHNKTNSTYWRILVTNRDRDPIILKRVFNGTIDLDWLNETTLSNVEFNQTTLEFELSKINGNYTSSGSITFPMIVFRTTDFENPKVYLTTDNLINDNLCNTSITYQYRFSTNNPPLDFISDLTWSDWSAEFSSSTTDLNASTSSKYWQIKVNLFTNCTNQSPKLKGLSFVYEPKTIDVFQGVDQAQWLYLPDFVYDPDKDDTLRYNATSVIPGIEVSPDPAVEPWPNTGWLYLTTPSYFAGTTDINVSVKDNDNKEVYAEFPVNVLERPSEVGTTIQYKIKTKTEIQYQEKIVEKEVPRYESFNLIVPERITLYPNDSVVVPITLDNYGNKTLNEVRLSANSSRDDVDIFFTQDYFKVIKSKSQEKTELIVTTKNIYGGFDIVVSAEVQDPPFNDTAKIIMATLEKGEHNSSQLYTKVSFTRDLLKSNEECLELNEMVDQAENLINQQKYGAAEQLLQSTIEACKYLVSTEKSKELKVKQSPIKFEVSLKNNLFIFITILSVSFVLLIIIVYWLVQSRRR
ncbi:MAG: large repetitive protein [Candidatus Woesearchaeota archaeon]|nr:large repetitive protein [Candidatus Woesearchaeota archaeon]